VAKRFAKQGRMLPEGVAYHASWVDAASARCFQIMEAPDRESLEEWVSRWSDLIEFETIPMIESKEYWATDRR
jgi:hypothetical protein